MSGLNQQRNACAGRLWRSGGEALRARQAEACAARPAAADRYGFLGSYMPIRNKPNSAGALNMPRANSHFSHASNIQVGASSEAALYGIKAVRLLYLDESGTSNNGREPWLIVAGVLIDGDRHYKAVCDRLNQIKKDNIPEEHWENFRFHATELFSGGKYFKRETTKNIDRLKILQQLSEIPSEFDFPVIWGAIRKTVKEKLPVMEALPFLQSFAYLSCLNKAEGWLRRNVPGEIAQVIAEDAPDVKKILRQFHQLTGKQAILETTVEKLFDQLPRTHIVGTIHFAAKSDDPLLQLADMCAFCIKKRITGSSPCDEHFEKLKPQLVEGILDPVSGGEF